MEIRYYELPNNPIVVSSVVQAIPSNWCWVDGELRAPDRLKERGRISEDSVLVISRFYGIKPTIKGAEKFDKDSGHYLPVVRAGVKIKEIILDRKLPYLVSFNEAAFGTRYEITMDDVKTLAKGFIEIGYQGTLEAYRDYHDNSKYDNSARFEINQRGRKENRFFREPELPPHVKLQWDGKYGGRREHLDSIIESCERIGLARIQLQEA